MVTGAVGVAAYEALRKMVVKAPLRAATVSVATGFNVDAVRALAAGIANPRSCAAATIAAPMGCSEPDSTAAASRST